MSALPASMNACHVHAWCPWGSPKGVRSHGTGLMDDHRLPCGWWKSNLGSLQEQLLVLTNDAVL